MRTRVQLLRLEDFPAEHRGWLEPLLRTLNNFMTDATSILSGGATFQDNIASFITVQVIQPARTSPYPVRLKNTLGKTPTGVVILGATDVASKAPVSLTGTPAWNVNKGDILIYNIPGLDTTKATSVTFLVF